MSRVRGFLLHTGVVCSFVCIIANILDWYNPYMNFSGHIWFAQAILYLAVITLAVTGKYTRPQRKKRRRGWRCKHGAEKNKIICG